MNFPANFFYLSVGLATWVAVAAFVFVAIEVVSTLRSVHNVLSDVKKSVADLEMLKSSIKVGILTLVSNLLGHKSKQKGGAAKNE